MLWPLWGLHAADHEMTETELRSLHSCQWSTDNSERSRSFLNTMCHCLRTSLLKSLPFGVCQGPVARLANAHSHALSSCKQPGAPTVFCAVLRAARNFRGEKPCMEGWQTGAGLSCSPSRKGPHSCLEMRAIALLVYSQPLAMKENFYFPKGKPS